jgi:hypothetical protein
MLDTLLPPNSPGRRRGRKPHARYQEVAGRALHYQKVFDLLQLDCQGLRRAQSEDAVNDIIAQTDPYYRERFLSGRESAIFRAIGDKRCPRTSGPGFRRFLAVALAGAEYGLSPRRSEVIVRDARLDQSLRPLRGG